MERLQGKETPDCLCEREETNNTTMMRSFVRAMPAATSTASKWFLSGITQRAPLSFAVHHQPAFRSTFLPSALAGISGQSWARTTKNLPQFKPDGKGDITLSINGRPVTVPSGVSILDACRASHIYVPTMCYHPMLSIVAQCRICLVEMKEKTGGGTGRLVSACSTKAEDGMTVMTRTDEVEKTVKQNLALLRCRHPNRCMTCEASGHCDLQDLAYHFQVEDCLPSTLHRPRPGERDLSSFALIRDMSKCVLCTRCIRVCSEIQGMNILGLIDRGSDLQVTTPDDVPIADTQCISCGQCTSVCPVGALIERPHIHQVQHILNSKGNKVIVAQTAPAVRVAISEEFGMEPGTVGTGKLVSALRTIGFDYVFDTNFTADLTIMEEAHEFVHRLTTGQKMPMFTSCCPGWINLVEKSYPKLLPQLSTCKSPEGMMSSLIKHYFAAKKGVKPEDVVVVSIMPCVAKKDEMNRPQLWYKSDNGTPTPETDYVLTTRELGQYLRRARIPFASLPDSEYDNPLGESTGAAALFGATGGVMEAALRTAHFLVTGKDLEKIVFEEVRDLDHSVHGLKEATVKIADINLRVAVVTGTLNVRRLIERVLAGEKRWDLIEVMACTGGCIGGGGEPKTHSVDSNILMKRIRAIYSIDSNSKYRMSHHNPSIKKIYEEFLGAPNSEESHRLLHTHYTDRSAEVKVISDNWFQQ